MVSVTLLWGFFRFTRTGKAIRACADNQIGAQVVGLDVSRLYAVTFGIGAACVGAAGTLMLLLVDVQPYISTRLHAALLRHRHHRRVSAACRARCSAGS